MPTIKDIAKLAGVSHGTVSNVLNKTGKVSVEKIRLVEQAAAELGYIPNVEAQRLRHGNKKLIAFIFPDFFYSRYENTYKEIFLCLKTHGYDISVFLTGNVQFKEEEILLHLPYSQLTGIILISCLKEMPDWFQPECPVVFLHRHPNHALANSAFLSFNYYLAGKDIATYLRSIKSKRIAFVSFFIDSQEERDFLSGMKSILDNADCSLQMIEIIPRQAMHMGFSILTDSNNYDVVVSTMPECAISIKKAHSYCQKDLSIPIVCIDSLSTFKNMWTNHVYNLDDTKLGHDAALSLLALVKESAPLSFQKTIDNNGFRPNLPHVIRTIQKPLRLLTLAGPSTDALQKITNAYSAQTGIVLQVTCLPYEDLYSLIKLGVDDVYDLVRMDIAWVDEMKDKAYIPLNTFPYSFDTLSNKIYPEFLTIFQNMQCNTHALPLDPSVELLVFRKDLFENATLQRLYYEQFHKSLTVPNDFDEFIRVAKFFTRSYNINSPVEYGCCQTYGSPAVAACDYLPRLLCSGKSRLESRSQEFANASNIKALENYVESHKYSSCKENGWWADSLSEFSSGNSAMLITFSNYIPSIMNSHSPVAGRIGMASVPGNKPLLGGGIIGISKNSRHVDYSWDYLQWLYSDINAKAMIMLGGSLPHKAVFNDCETINSAPWLQEISNNYPLCQRGFPNNRYPSFSLKRYEYILGTAVKNAVTGQMTPEEALLFAQKLFERCLLGDS